jgi:hypothetical protein
MESQKQHLVLFGGIIIPIMFLAFGCGGGSKVTDVQKDTTSGDASSAVKEATTSNNVVYPAKKRVQETKHNIRVKAGDKAFEPLSEAMSGKEVDAEADLPSFPWPPSESAKAVEIPFDFLKNAQSKPIYLGDIDKKLRNAMSESGYDDRKSYFRVPNGFALVTQREHIKPDGTPRKLNRWGTIASETLDSFTLQEYFNFLFKANPGYYRTIAFIITSESFPRTGKPLTADGIDALLPQGRNRLSSSVAKSAFTNKHYITALIYEFKRTELGAIEPIQLNADAKTHLQKSNLWNELRI